MSLNKHAVIKNFGFLWKKEYIYRGNGGNSGHLKGIKKGKKTKVVDFREQIGIYALYDAGLNIVYIGQAGYGEKGLFARLKQHLEDRLRDRWMYFSWLGFKDVNNDGMLCGKQKATARVSGYRYRDAMDEMEGLLIALLEPNLNKQGAKWKKTAEEYLQYRDDNLREPSINDIKEELGKLKKDLLAELKGQLLRHPKRDVS